jgi:hypothetical protein
MKSLFFPMMLVLCGCATAPSPPVSAAASRPPPAPGTLTVTGEELKQTGRTDLADALRMSSPIFH